MSTTASVVNGEIKSDYTNLNKTKENGSTLDKDAFLQLLVTQMKYQDPLEPTDNTEYVSQLATFSELEEMQNMTSAMDMSRATSLVGQYVTVKVTNENTGITSLTGGKVDYVVVENNKAYLNIDGENYSVDDLDSIVDKDYLDAYNLSNDWVASFMKLPTVDNLTTAYEDVIENLRSVYDDMTSYQKSFISDNHVKMLKAYEDKLGELKAVEEAIKADAEKAKTE